MYRYISFVCFLKDRGGSRVIFPQCFSWNSNKWNELISDLKCCIEINIESIALGGKKLFDQNDTSCKIASKYWKYALRLKSNLNRARNKENHVLFSAKRSWRNVEKEKLNILPHFFSGNVHEKSPHFIQNVPRTALWKRYLLL